MLTAELHIRMRTRPGFGQRRLELQIYELYRIYSPKGGGRVNQRNLIAIFPNVAIFVIEVNLQRIDNRLHRLLTLSAIWALFAVPTKRPMNQLTERNRP